MKSWQLKREVATWEVYTGLRLGMLIIIDHFDWNTNQKYFESEHAYRSWIWGLHKRYNVDRDTLKLAVILMKDAELITVKKLAGEARLMTLQAPTKKEEAVTSLQERWEQLTGEGVSSE